MLMGDAVGIGAFIATLLVMIIIHEAGHFTVAKSFGIKVEKFFLGFGPRLWSTKRGETEYGVSIVLLGGYVKIAGMTPWEPVPPQDLPRTFGAKPAWQRALVLLAGSAMHLVMGFVMLVALFGLVGVPQPTTQVRALVAAAAAPSPAKVAGIAPGDRIVAIDGRKVDTWEELRSIVRSRAPGSRVAVTVRKPTGTSTVKAVLAAQLGARGKQYGFLGVSPAEVARRENPVAATSRAARHTGTLVVGSVKGIGTLFSPGGMRALYGTLSGRGRRATDGGEVVGLVGSARLAGQAARAGAIAQLIYMLAGFVIFVGVINLVPLPPLDGGHLAVLAYEKVFRQKVDLRRLLPITGFVLVLLIFLTLSLLYLDISRPINNPFQ